jgi:hypothetical protein
VGGLRHRWHEAQAARQRALPKTEDLPPAQRRLDEVCAAGYAGRKRGEVLRTRTVVSQAHTYPWLGSFGNRGNGEYRKELALALVVIRRYLEALGLRSLTCPAAIGRPLRHWGRHCRSGQPLLRDARQRLRGVGSPDRAGAAPLAPRCPLQSPGKHKGSALSTTAPMSLWGRRAAASWWLPTWRPRKRAASVAPARAWSTNSFSPISRKMGSPPPMSWHSRLPSWRF